MLQITSSPASARSNLSAALPVSCLSRPDPPFVLARQWERPHDSQARVSSWPAYDSGTSLGHKRQNDASVQTISEEGCEPVVAFRSHHKVDRSVPEVQARDDLAASNSGAAQEMLDALSLQLEALAELKPLADAVSNIEIYLRPLYASVQRIETAVSSLSLVQTPMALRRAESRPAPIPEEMPIAQEFYSQTPVVSSPTPPQQGNIHAEEKARAASEEKADDGTDVDEIVVNMINELGSQSQGKRIQDQGGGLFLRMGSSTTERRFDGTLITTTDGNGTEDGNLGGQGTSSMLVVNGDAEKRTHFDSAATEAHVRPTSTKSFSSGGAVSPRLSCDTLQKGGFFQATDTKGTDPMVYASYPFDTMQADALRHSDHDHATHAPGLSSPSSPKRRKSGMQKLAEREHEGGLAAEVVRSMIVKHSMHHLGGGLTGAGNNPIGIMLDRLYRLAIWFDDNEEPERDGCLANILNSAWFEVVSMFAIVTNSVFVAFAADWSMKNPGEQLPRFTSLIEIGFMSFYIVELLLKLLVHRMYFFVNGEMKWNWLDFVLVVISSVEVFATLDYANRDSDSRDRAGDNMVFMRIIRIMKLAKIFRAFRAMQFVKELVTIMESLKQSMLAMFWVFVMLVFMLCMFSLVILQGMAEFVADQKDHLTEPETALIYKTFGSISKTMLTLYMAVTGGDDWAPFYRMVESTGSFYAGTFLFFTFFFTFALFNMLTGIFVEKTVAVATPDRAELALNQRRALRRDAQEFKNVCLILDSDGDGEITWKDFEENMHNETMVAYLASIGLEIHDVEMFFKMVCGSTREERNPKVAIDRFVHKCLQLKGLASSIDMQQQLFEMHALARHLFRYEHVMLKLVHHIEHNLQASHDIHASEETAATTL